MTPCPVCERPLIRGVCPECEPSAFVDAMFAMDVSPQQFISPAHYGAWMRREPLRVEGRGKINGRWKAVVFRQYGHKCVHCGATALLTFGHIVPVAFGGSDQPCNGLVECEPCNRRQFPPLAPFLARAA